ncbi:hypothetical protein GP486_000919 [Trichoglossum hirsutum]|uniref:Uncharacterized protein n=1 Tax=Trichoglossum hirsutum TaxID=265104 RepID=A0A9P8LHT7_9PEZI|nr:hypothetical protein GP486_000919 [Trichoglossum hirsutum]
MPTGIHKYLIAGIEDSLLSQLKVIRIGSDTAALFAQKLRSARFTTINFPIDDTPPTTMSKHELDASFRHADAKYPGVIIEVSYSQKRKRLDRLAEEYLLDSDASAFCDDQGNPTDNPGLRLRLSDFTHKGLTEDIVRDGDREILLSTQQLCQYLTDGEDQVRRWEMLSKNPIPPGVKKRKRSRTPPERITSDDKAKYVEQEQKAAKRMEDDDSDY